MTDARAPWVFLFRRHELLLEGGERLVAAHAAIAPHLAGAEAIGELEGRPCLALEAPEGFEPAEPYRFVGLRASFAPLGEAAFAMAGRASQVLTFMRDHRFCGRCGTATAPGPAPTSRACPTCGLHHFPRLSPAVIVAVRRGDRVLLGRAPHFAPGMYSTLAGFVEAGETLEEAVRREVREEVGIEVGAVRYFGSQPWPFPHSLMVGFTAEWAAGELTPDGAEILDARWFEAGEMPVVPGKLSIARALIEDFMASVGGDAATLASP